MLPTTKALIIALALAACVVCSTLCAAPAGWTCDASGCRPSMRAAGPVRAAVRDRRPLRRLFARVARRGC